MISSRITNMVTTHKYIDRQPKHKEILYLVARMNYYVLNSAPIRSSMNELVLNQECCWADHSVTRCVADDKHKVDTTSLHL